MLHSMFICCVWSLTLPLIVIGSVSSKGTCSTCCSQSDLVMVASMAKLLLVLAFALGSPGMVGRRVAMKLVKLCAKVL